MKDASGNSITNRQSAIGNRYLFQGREYDAATGLYYFRARWYDPDSGRWLSKDPIGIRGGLNQYEFCASNPVNFTDPLGLCEKGWDPDWGAAGNALANMMKGLLQTALGGALAAGDGPLPFLDILGAGLAIDGIGDIALNYGHLLGALMGTDMSDVPTDFTDMAVDGITGNDEAGDVAGDVVDFLSDAAGEL